MNNLVHDAWVPVIDQSGKYAQLSITDALKNAGYVQLAPRNPMDKISIVRFLLAVCYWCSDKTSESISEEKTLPNAWLQFLDENAEVFNLFGPGKPFLQDRTAKRMRPSSDLLQEVPVGNNFWHFKHGIDYVNGICPACCVLGLLRLPLFAVSGLPDLKAGINGTPPIYTILWGSNLLATLKLNWSPIPELGEPAWTHPIPISPENEVPLLNGLTMLPRKVLLHEPQGDPEACVCCGNAEHKLIYSCYYDATSAISNDNWKDPHVVYNPNTEKPTKTFDPVSAGDFIYDKPWQDVIANYLDNNPYKNYAKLLLVGLATQQAKNIDVWEQEISLKCNDMLPVDAQTIRDWRRRLYSVFGKLNYSLRSKEAGKALFLSLSPHTEALMTAPESLLCMDRIELQKHISEVYSHPMKCIAKSAFPGISLSHHHKRRHIFNMVPVVAENVSKEISHE